MDWFLTGSGGVGILIRRSRAKELVDLQTLNGITRKPGTRENSPTCSDSSNILCKWLGIVA